MENVQMKANVQTYVLLVAKFLSLKYSNIHL